MINSVHLKRLTSGSSSTDYISGSVGVMKMPKVPVDSQDIILYINAKNSVIPLNFVFELFLLLSQNARKSDKTPFHIRGHIFGFRSSNYPPLTI